jgi:hypothetical protein
VGGKEGRPHLVRRKNLHPVRRKNLHPVRREGNLHPPKKKPLTPLKGVSYSRERSNEATGLTTGITDI